MPVDLTAIRALLASVAGFTPGPLLDATGNARTGDNYACVGCGAWRPVRHREVCPHDDGCEADRQEQAFRLARYALSGAAPDLHRDLTEAVGEIERLRAHNARMVAQINALADACDREESATPGSFPICDALPSGHWPETAAALRRLAAGEVDDG